MTGDLRIQYWTIIETFRSQQRINSNTLNRWIHGATTSLYEAYSYGRRNAILHVWTHTNTAIISTHEQLEHEFSVNVTKNRIIKATNKRTGHLPIEWYACLFVEKRWHRWRQRVCLLRSYCDRLPATTTTATIDRWFCNWRYVQSTSFVCFHRCRCRHRTSLWLSLDITKFLNADVTLVRVRWSTSQDQH